MTVLCVSVTPRNGGKKSTFVLLLVIFLWD